MGVGVGVGVGECDGGPMREKCPNEKQRYGNCGWADRGIDSYFHWCWFYLFLRKILRGMAKECRGLFWFDNVWQGL